MTALSQNSFSQKSFSPTSLRWYGAAPSADRNFSMALPDAQARRGQLYCPRGVYFDDNYLLVCDSGNHRLLVWKIEDDLPPSHSEADFVIGQPDFESEGPKLLHLPTGVTMHQGMLLVADAWHHRILVWSKLPENGEPPDFIIGQDSLEESLPNCGAAVSDSSLYWPYGLAFVEDRLYIADTGNRRVVYLDHFSKLSKRDCSGKVKFDGLLGQDSFDCAEENRGAIGAASFRWAHDICASSETLFIADAGNHRVLGFPRWQSDDCAASLVLGQRDFVSWEEFPYRPQSPSVLRFPYGVSYDDGVLAVADTANNRVLLFEHLPSHGAALPAQAVIGQPDFTKNGENNWKEVTDKSLCWPYGLHLHKGKLAIADSGNNRVLVFSI